jgi:hypothetical protein
MLIKDKTKWKLLLWITQAIFGSSGLQGVWNTNKNNALSDSRQILLYLNYKY